MSEVTRTLSLKHTDQKKIRRPIAHSELWAWAEETLRRNRVHAVGLQGPSSEPFLSSLEYFEKTLKSEGWLSLKCIGSDPVSIEHQLSSQLFDLEQRIKLPKHVEIIAHHRSKQFLDGKAADEKLSSLRHHQEPQSTNHSDEEQAWNNLKLDLPDEWSLITDLSKDEYTNDLESMDNSVDNDSPLANLTPIQRLISNLQLISQSQPLTLLVLREHLTSSDREFLEQLVRNLRIDRSDFPLLLVWLDPHLELDDLVDIKTKLIVSSSPPSSDDISIKTADSIPVEDVDILEKQNEPSISDFSEQLEASFDRVFNETFNAQAEIAPVEKLVEQSLRFSDLIEDPLLLMTSTDSSKESSLSPRAKVPNSHSPDQLLQTELVSKPNSNVDFADHLSSADDQYISPEHTTTELKKVSTSPPQDIGLIDRGNYTQCLQITTDRFGELAVLLTAAAACGPTSSIGQVVSLWRGIIERPLDEFHPFNESLWDMLSTALSDGILVETTHYRFANEPSFRFNETKQALKWRKHWRELLSIRLLRRSHRTLAYWMMHQTLNPLARPQIALNIIDHFVEAGEMGEAGGASLSAAKLFLRKGDSYRAKKSLQRTVQLLGPEGSWPVWKECFELLLKLNLETGDDLAAELISKQFIERAWRVGEIGLTRKLSGLLERLYKTTGRLDEAQAVGDWSASQPLIDQTTALFDVPLTVYPKSLSESNLEDLEETYRSPTVVNELPPPQESSSPAEDCSLMNLPEIHTLEAPPSFLLQVLVTLRDHGYEAFVVGGSVRDRLLGRYVNDWDIATSALPDEVIQSFDKVIKTGIEHGTVTVIIEGEHVEITTYRVDGEYQDGRRPEAVTFTRSIEEDLLRRDFTVNAIAWDPINATLTDPYDGCLDLQKGIIRAVGDPHLRFQEDGLRVLRAVRFATTLDFVIDHQTKVGAKSALNVLQKVAVERIQVEFFKTLASPHASRGLTLLRDLEIEEICIPKQVTLPDEQWQRLCVAMSHCIGELNSRLALVFHAIQNYENRSQVHFAKQVRTTLKTLKVSNKQSQNILNLLSFSSLDPSIPRSDGLIRALAVDIGLNNLDQLWSYHEAWWSSEKDEVVQLHQLSAWQELRETMTRLKVEEAPQSPKDLNISGHDLCEALDLFPSKVIGELLNDLLKWVWEDPQRNTHQTLIEQANVIALERGLVH